MNLPPGWCRRRLDERGPPSIRRTEDPHRAEKAGGHEWGGGGELADVGRSQAFFLRLVRVADDAVGPEVDDFHDELVVAVEQAAGGDRDAEWRAQRTPSGRPLSFTSANSLASPRSMQKTVRRGRAFPFQILVDRGAGVVADAGLRALAQSARSETPPHRPGRPSGDRRGAPVMG